MVNIVVLDIVFSFKNSNTVITNYELEFDLITVVLDNDICFLNFFNCRCLRQ